MVRVPANLCLQSQAKSAVLEKCPDGASVIPIRRGWLTLGSPLQPGEYFFVLHGVSRDPFSSKRCQRLRPRAISLSGHNYCRGTGIARSVQVHVTGWFHIFQLHPRDKDHCLGKQYHFTKRSEGLSDPTCSHAWHRYDATGADLRSQHRKLTTHSWS
jgi:hypothetical protein